MVKIDIVLSLADAALPEEMEISNYLRSAEVCAPPAIGSFIVFGDNDPKRRLDLTVFHTAQHVGSDSIQVYCVLRYESNEVFARNAIETLGTDPNWGIEE